MLPRWLARGVAPEVQDHAHATLTRPLRKEDGHLDWNQSASQLERAVHAYAPWPGTYTTWEGRQLKVRRAHALTDPLGHAPGACFTFADGNDTVLACACDHSALVLDVLQLEGKRALPSAEMLRGYPALATAQLGS